VVARLPSHSRKHASAKSQNFEISSVGLHTALNAGGVAVVLSRLVAFDGGVAFGGSALRPVLRGPVEIFHSSQREALVADKA
jgi:hypothetical protein